MLRLLASLLCWLADRRERSLVALEVDGWREGLRREEQEHGELDQYLDQWYTLPERTDSADVSNSKPATQQGQD
jgi:hypothetical protein